MKSVELFEAFGPNLMKSGSYRLLALAGEIETFTLFKKDRRWAADRASWPQLLAIRMADMIGHAELDEEICQARRDIVAAQVAGDNDYEMLHH